MDDHRIQPEHATPTQQQQPQQQQLSTVSATEVSLQLSRWQHCRWCHHHAVVMAIIPCPNQLSISLSVPVTGLMGHRKI